MSTVNITDPRNTWLTSFLSGRDWRKAEIDRADRREREAQEAEESRQRLGLAEREMRVREDSARSLEEDRRDRADERRSRAERENEDRATRGQIWQQIFENAQRLWGQTRGTHPPGGYDLIMGEPAGAAEPPGWGRFTPQQMGGADPTTLRGLFDTSFPETAVTPEPADRMQALALVKSQYAQGVFDLNPLIRSVAPGVGAAIRELVATGARSPEELDRVSGTVGMEQESDALIDTMLGGGVDPDTKKRIRQAMRYSERIGQDPQQVLKTERETRDQRSKRQEQARKDTIDEIRALQQQIQHSQRQIMDLRKLEIDRTVDPKGFSERDQDLAEERGRLKEAQESLKVLKESLRGLDDVQVKDEEILSEMNRLRTNSAALYDAAVQSVRASKKARQ